MGRFAPTFTPEQERAIAGAMLGDYGRPMTAKQACAAAAAGHLGLEPFTVKLKTAYVLRDRQERQRAPSQPKRNATLEDRAQILLDARMTRLERDARGGKLDVEELRKVIRAGAELRRARKEPAVEPEQSATTEPEQTGYLARLAAAEHQGSNDTQADTGTSTTDATTENATEDNAMPVRSDGQI